MERTMRCSCKHRKNVSSQRSKHVGRPVVEGPKIHSTAADSSGPAGGNCKRAAGGVGKLAKSGLIGWSRGSSGAR